MDWTTSHVRGAFHQLCQIVCASARAGAPRGGGLPSRIVAAVAVDEEEAAEALAVEGREQLGDHLTIRIHAQRRAAGIGREVRRDAVRQSRQHRHAERLGRFDGDPLGEDDVDGEREVRVLLDGSQRQHDPVVVSQVLLELHPVAVPHPHADTSS